MGDELKGALKGLIASTLMFSVFSFLLFLFLFFIIFYFYLGDELKGALKMTYCQYSWFLHLLLYFYSFAHIMNTHIL